MGKVGNIKYKNNSTYYVEIYSSKEELSGESAFCIGLPDGKVGYVPLTKNATRKGRIKVISQNGEEYNTAVIKKERYKDIARCEFKLYIYDGNVEYDSVSVRGRANGNGNSFRATVYASFYDDKGELMDYNRSFTEDTVSLEILINSYATSYGNGNDYYVAFDGVNLINGTPSYYNSDIVITSRFDKSTSWNTNAIQLRGSSSGSSSTVINNLTIKSVKIQGRDIPFTITRIM